MSPEGIDESLHSLGGIEELRARTGFSLERQELRFEWTRDSRGCSTRLDVLESLRRVTKSSTTKPTTRAHESAKENRISIKRGSR